MPEIRNFMTSPDLGPDERAAIEIKREFPWWIMGSNQSLDRMSIKLPLLESTGPWARLYFVCFSTGALCPRGRNRPASKRDGLAHTRGLLLDLAVRWLLKSNFVTHCDRPAVVHHVRVSTTPASFRIHWRLEGRRPGMRNLFLRSSLRSDLGKLLVIPVRYAHLQSS